MHPHARVCPRYKPENFDPEGPSWPSVSVSEQPLAEATFLPGKPEIRTGGGGADDRFAGVYGDSTAAANPVEISFGNIIKEKFTLCSLVKPVGIFHFKLSL